ncbi:MAG: NAD(P)-binding domain-containing protein [Gammaproteobacteria bacterium]
MAEKNSVEVGIVGVGSLVDFLIARLLEQKICLNILQSQKSNNSDSKIRCCQSLKELRKESDFVITACTDGPELEETLLGKNGLITDITYGGSIIDMSSVSPELIHEISEQLIEKGVSFLDAAIINEEHSESGLIQMILVGGDEREFDNASPLLKRIAENVKLIGANGASQFYRQAFGVRKKYQ